MATKKKAAKKAAPKKAVKKAAAKKVTVPAKTKDNTSDIVKQIIDLKIKGLKNREIVAMGFNKHTVNSQTSLFNCGKTRYQGAGKPLRVLTGKTKKAAAPKKKAAKKK